jgi:hypothetical protein
MEAFEKPLSPEGRGRVRGESFEGDDPEIR